MFLYLIVIFIIMLCMLFFCSYINLRIIDCNQVFNLYSSRESSHEILKSFVIEYYVFQVQSIKHGQGYSTMFLEKNVTLNIEWCHQMYHHYFHDSPIDSNNFQNGTLFSRNFVTTRYKEKLDICSMATR